MRRAVLPLLMIVLVGCAPHGALAPLAPNASTLAGPGAASALSLAGVAKYEGLYSHAGIHVQLSASAFQAETETDATGQYSFPHLASGSYQLSFTKPGYYPQAQVVTLPLAPSSVPGVTMTNHRLIYPNAALYDPSRYQARTSLVLTPDHAHLAFAEGNALKRIALDGSNPSVVVTFSLPATERIDSFDWTSAGLVYAQTGTGSASIWRTSAADPTSPLLLATQSANPLLSPVFSPDGSAIAFLEHQVDPANNSFELAFYRQNLADQAIAPVGAFDISSSYDYGLGPLAWTPAGLLFHKPMYCAIYQNRHADGPVGDGIYLLSPDNLSTPQGSRLTKLWFYSDYDHCLSTDAQVVYFHDGRRILARKVSDPSDYDQGAVPVGYDGSADVASLVAGPRGDRLYYVSARGVEEMTLLP